MPVVAKTIILLVLSNVFMTFAWYAHLKNLSHRPWIVAALISWGIALLAVFVPFAAFYMKEPVRLNFLWAAVCLCGAVYFVFTR